MAGISTTVPENLFVVFLKSSKKMTALYLKLSHNNFRPHSPEFIIKK